MTICNPQLYFLAGFLGPSTAFSTVPAMPPLLASNWLPIMPSFEKGPPIFSPVMNIHVSVGQPKTTTTMRTLTDLPNVSVGVELTTNGALGRDDAGVGRACVLLLANGLGSVVDGVVGRHFVRVAIF